MKRLLLGTPETIAGTVYGTIVVLTALTAGSHDYAHDLWTLGTIALVGALVLWIAHVYSHGLGESLNEGRRLTAAELGEIARRELSIPLAGVLPIGVVYLGALEAINDSLALWLAFAIGVTALTVQGVRYARLERLSVRGTIVSVALNLGLGLVIVALEVAVHH